jgi:hypothetical protein
VEEKFYGWSLIYVKPTDREISFSPYASNSSFTASLEEAKLRENYTIYLIWYTNARVEEFSLLHSSGAISVYLYAPKV